MTIGIVAFTKDKKHIVAVCDRMLSSGGVVQATDNATLKMRGITKGWGAVFAADNANLFPALLAEAIKRVSKIKNKIHIDTEIRKEVEASYRHIFDQQFSGEHLSRLGYNNILDFRSRGLTELGADKFGEILEKINNYDIGITLLVYGFDSLGSPDIFQVSNPGIITDHNLLHYAVIGSGFWMATASLRRRPPGDGRESTIYRLLEAKFSSETASGVGRSTAVMTMENTGKVSFAGSALIDQVRDIWINSVNSPDPADAIKLIAEAPMASKIAGSADLTPSSKTPSSAPGP